MKVTKYDTLISLKNENTHALIGKIIINTKLLCDGILMTQTRGKHYHKKLNGKISDELQSVIKTLILTSTIDYSVLKDLSKDDKNLFKELIKKAGLTLELNFEPSKMEYSKKDLIKLYRVQRGEVEAGNDSIDLLFDIKKTLRLLHDYEIIDNDKYLEMDLEIDGLINPEN